MSVWNDFLSDTNFACLFDRISHAWRRIFYCLRIILDLIETKTIGCFDLLDEESKLPTPRAEHFTAEVHNRNKGHPRLDVRIDSMVFLKRMNSNLVTEKIEITFITWNSWWWRFSYSTFCWCCGLFYSKYRMSEISYDFDFVFRHNLLRKIMMHYIHLFVFWFKNVKIILFKIFSRKHRNSNNQQEN